MSVGVQERLLSIDVLTPPPSDLDDCDMTRLLNCSPVLSQHCYPSPTPSYQDYYQNMPPTGQPKYRYQEDDISYVNNMESVDSQVPLFFQQDTPAATMNTRQQSAFFQPTFTSEPTPLYDTTLDLQSATPAEIYPTFSTQTSWSSSYPAYAGIRTSTLSYPPQELLHNPYATNVIPPTPHTTDPSPFDFANPFPQHSLSTSSSFNHHSLTHSSVSASSLSRSCSPTPYQQSAPTPTVSYASTLTPQSTLPLRSNSQSSTHSQSSISLHAYGIPLPTTDPANPSWRCAYPNCTSRAVFTRGCDLRKHYNRHSKHLFCRVDGCPQSQAAAAVSSRDGMLSGGFSSKKDRARHEAKHNPGIRCEWKGSGGEQCGRVFSRMDNMKDHVRRIHHKGERDVGKS